MSELIRVERETGLLTLRLDRQDKKNALTRAMYSRMAEALLLEAQADTAVRVVLITGGDACFTSGNGILDFLEQPPSLRDSRSAASRRPAGIPQAGDRRGERTGSGIGTTLLLHCDLVFVGRNARLKMPFVNLGLTPEFGSPILRACSVMPGLRNC